MLYFKSNQSTFVSFAVLAYCVSNHWVKSVQIRSYFWCLLSPNTGKCGPEITPFLDTFHPVNVKLLFLFCASFWIKWGSTLTLNRMDTQPTFHTTTWLPFQFFLLAKFLFKDTQREKAHSNKIPTFTRSMNINVWVVGRMSCLLEILIPNQNFQKKKKKKGSSYLQSLIGPFCTPHSICFNMASDRAVLHGNVALSISVISPKKQYSSFLKKLSVFRFFPS